VIARDPGHEHQPAGRLASAHGATEQLVRVEGKIKDAREFNKIIVARRANGPVYLEQVATVIDGEQEELSISRLNGQRAVSIDITKVQDANVVEVGTAHPESRGRPAADAAGRHHFDAS
jgi:multidrug efflux pump subunit AcrB